LIEFIIMIIVLAIIMEMIDAGFGMGYGTVLSPVLIAFGVPVLTVVPSVLISQAIGGFTASAIHHKLKNAELMPTKEGIPKDLKVSIIITVLGVIATILAVFLAVSIPAFWIKLYIGVLVLAMGLLILSNFKFVFSWGKMAIVGIISSFNKGLSGGGFGPVVTGGQIIAGQNNKNAVGATTLAEAPICITGFVCYVLLQGFPDLNIMLPLIIGAIIGAPIGAFLTNKIPEKHLKLVIGILITILGLWTLIKLFM